jgi:peptide/nickel transport system substrate-binding protein
MSVLSNIYSCWPWNYNEANEPFPNMLTEMPTASEDGLTVTMHLRDDLVWSDGEPLTADDFIFTYEMIVDPANSVSSQYPYDMLASVTAPDPQTVVMTFSDVFVPWLNTFWQGTIMPKHVLEPVFEAEGTIDAAEWNTAPTVGCGPFNFTEWESGSYIRFDRNENYWGTPAILDRVVFQMVPDDAAQTAACLAGDADICYWPPYPDIPRFLDIGLEVVVEPGGYNEGWFFNLRDMASPGIKDLNVRKAIAMALDREGNTVLRENVVAVNETFWDAIPAYVSPDIEPWPYDPAAAMQLLEDSGWIDTDGDGIRENADGEKLVIKQGNTTKEERVAYQALAQQQLLAVGIDLQTQALESDILFDSFSNGGPAATGTLDIFMVSDVPYFPDPDTSYWMCSEIPSEEYPTGWNYYVCDEALDALFQQQLVTIDPEERIEIFHQISQYMHDNVYYLGIWEDPDTWVVNPARVANYKFSGVTPFYNIAEWDIP